MKKVRFQEAEIPAPQFTHNQDPAKKIESIQFALMKASDIQKNAEAKIINKQIYQDQSTGTPFKGGPLDLRLGLSGKGKTCETCNKTLENCPGHFGNVQLELPVFHVGYFKQTVNILQCICKTCCRVMIFEKDRLKYIHMYQTRMDSQQRGAVFKQIVQQCKKIKTCPHCQAFNGTIKKMPNQAVRIIHAKYNDKANFNIDEAMNEFAYSCMVNTQVEAALKSSYEEFDALKVMDLFERIKDEDVPLFDMDPEYCRPIDLLITHIPVPPSCIRPSVPVQNGTSNEDDLTIKILEILQLNTNIKLYIQEGTSPKKLMDEWLLLTYTITQYFNSDTPGLPYNLLGSKSIRSFSQRLKGKQGRFRLNLSAKRVDFTGRTVISPDPNCAIDEVIIPIYVAKNLTYPERVNQYNIEKMKQLIKNGPEVHPGANYVELPDGTKIFLQYANRKKVAEEIKIGDVVERHLENGDVVLFNRQPSLHRVSIMAHRARVMPNRTFRFNECVCTPYNADFDGDEMNIHFPQTEEAKAEARILMDVKQNLLVPKSGDPLIAATQDFLTSCYLITQKDTFFNRSQFMMICSYFGDANERIEIPPPSIIKPVELWTGKQIINVLLRPNRESNVYVNTVVKEKNYTQGEHMCPNDGWVIFQNSELICGNLCKTTMGSGSKLGLFYSLQRDNSVQAASRCMLRVSKFSSRWLSNYGMSIGISDVTPFEELIKEKESLLQIGYEKCDDYIEQYKNGKIVLKAGCNDEQTLESQLNGELSTIRDKAGTILRKKLPKYNAPLIMAISGSKGSDINLCQMIALVGQQTVNGQRMPNGFFDRSLPHFEPFSKYPASKGFVKNSFYSGLTATEFFFHTCGGREGLVDTAVKTAETGYMQRRLIKALEDLSIKYDETVRTSTQHVIQFQYGDDGLDPMFMDDTNQPVSLKRLFTIVKENTKQSALVISEDMLLPSEIREEAEKIVKNCYIKNVSTKFLETLKEFLFGIADEVSYVRRSIGVKDDKDNLVKEADLKAERKDPIVQKLLRNFTYLTKSQIMKFSQLVWEKYQRAQIQAGEAVGAVAAQSIGEPGTQMTLKTFHFAGVASMNVTLGVPRIKEIINATKDISTPIIEAKLVNQKDEVSARIVKGRIETTKLGGIASYIKEVYTPKGCFLEVELDLHVIDALKLEVNIQDVVNAIIAAKIKIKDKHIEIRDSKTIHIQPFDLSRENMYFSMQQLKNSLPGVIVKGINSVVRAVISKQQKDEKKFIMFVEGTGLKEVMNTPGIEFRQTKTNHIMEIEKVLGIEAARRTIINEIQYTMKSHGMNIDTRHIQLLADIMTFKGQVFGITRFGVSKMKNSTLMLASFEMTTDHLYESAMHCRKDEIKGVSECIIMGNMIPVGTGMFKLVYDENIKKGHISSSDGLQESLVVQANQSGGQDDLAFDQIEEIIKDNTLIVRK